MATDHSVSVQARWKLRITHSAGVSHSVSCLPEGYGALFTTVGVSSNYLQMKGDNLLPEPFLPGNTPFTGNIWVNFTTLRPASDLMTRWAGGGNEQFIIGYADSTNAPPIRDTFYAVINNGNVFNVGIVQCPQDLGITTGTWNMVTFAFDPANSQLLMWLNGVPAGSATWGGGMGNVNEGLMLGGRGGAGTAISAILERAFIHKNVVWTDAQVLALYNNGNGIPARLLDAYGLPKPTVWYEFEDPNNVGKNWWGYYDWDLGNSENAAHTSGLVTLVPGLTSPACPPFQVLHPTMGKLSFVPPPKAPLTHAPRVKAFHKHLCQLEPLVLGGVSTVRPPPFRERLMLPKFPEVPGARGYPLAGDTEGWRKKFQHILSSIK